MSTDETQAAAEPVTPWWELSGMERAIAKYEQCEEPGDCDHDHDTAIEYFREQELNGLRERAEKAKRERGDARAVALMLKNLLASMPTFLDELIGEDVWDELPDWFTDEDRGRDLWGGDDDE